MIDLDQIGYNVIQKDGDGSTEITGGLTLTVRIKVGSVELAPDPQAIVLHVKKRIREKIWEMAYGHLKEPALKIRKILDSDMTSFSYEPAVSRSKEALDKLEEALGEP